MIEYLIFYPREVICLVMSIINVMLYYLLLTILAKPAISVNYFACGVVGAVYLVAAQILGNKSKLFPNRAVLAALYFLPFYLIQKTQHFPGYGWAVLQNLIIIAMVILIWRDENFLTPPYLSPESPYRELDLAVPAAIFFYIGSMIVVPALGPKLVNWNQVQRDALLAFEGIFIYFVITRYFTEERPLERLTFYLSVAFILITVWGGVNLFNTYQAFNRTRYYLKQNQVQKAADSLEKTKDLNRLANLKSVQKELEKMIASRNLPAPL